MTLLAHEPLLLIVRVEQQRIGVPALVFVRGVVPPPRPGRGGAGDGVAVGDEEERARARRGLCARRRWRRGGVGDVSVGVRGGARGDVGAARC